MKCKVCIIGDWGVGKTSLIRKYVLDQYSDMYISTLGTKATKKCIVFKNGNEKIVNLTLQIWDVMGQKEFSKIQTVAYNGTHAALIVCDITRKETLESIKTWIAKLYSIANDIPIIILANKNDLLYEAKVKLEDLEKIAKEMNTHCLYTSAKTGENVEAAFRQLGSRLIAS